jgi:hypothetical protein
MHLRVNVAIARATVEVLHAEARAGQRMQHGTTRSRCLQATSAHLTSRSIQMTRRWEKTRPQVPNLKDSSNLKTEQPEVKSDHDETETDNVTPEDSLIITIGPSSLNTG